MDNEEELQDSLQPEEVDLDLELEEPKPEEAPPAEDVEALKQRMADLEAKNKQLYARVKKQSKDVQPLSTQPKDEEDIRETVRSLAQAESKRQFGYSHGLSPEETDAIFRMNPKPSKETLDDPFVKGGLAAIRAKKRVENATPAPSGKSATVDGKPWGQMTPEDRRKNYQKVVDKYQK